MLFLNPKLGRPPRMRGESDIPFERTVGAGLTPAYAGRIGHATVYFVPRVDPRACGENYRYEPSIVKTLG